MKSFRLFLFMILLVSAAGVEAEFNPRMIKKGIRGGAGIASVVNHERDSKNVVGYSLGVFGSYRQSPILTIQMELLFSGKGYKIPDATVVQIDPAQAVPDTVIIEGVEAKYLLNYIEIPLLAKISVPTGGKFVPYVTGGGFMSLMVWDRLHLTDSSGTLEFELENTKRADLGYIIGAGFDIKSGDGMIFFETRYEISAMEPIKNEDQKSRLLLFQVGYWW